MCVCDQLAGRKDKRANKERKGSDTTGRKQSSDEAVAEAGPSVGQPGDPGVDQEATEADASKGTPRDSARVPGQLLTRSASLQLRIQSPVAGL